MKNNKLIDVFGDFMDSYLKLSLFMFNFLFFGEKDVKFESEFQRNHFQKMRIAALLILLFIVFFKIKFALIIISLLVGFALFPWLLVLILGFGFVTYQTIIEHINSKAAKLKQD